jgi:hypothetical protein
MMGSLRPHGYELERLVESGAVSCKRKTDFKNAAAIRALMDLGRRGVRPVGKVRNAHDGASSRKSGSKKNRAVGTNLTSNDFRF